MRSWILSSYLNILYRRILYVSSSAQLWKEIKKRFGQANGSMFYQFRSDISSISQGNLCVADIIPN